MATNTVFRQRNQAVQLIRESLREYNKSSSACLLFHGLEDFPRDFPYQIAFTLVDLNNPIEEAVFGLRVEPLDLDKRGRLKQAIPARKPRATAGNNYNWDYLTENGIYPPTREALSFLMEAEGLQAQDVSDLLDVNIKTVLGWLSRVDKKTATVVPNAYWELLLLKLGRHPAKKLIDS